MIMAGIILRVLGYWYNSQLSKWGFTNGELYVKC